MTNNFLTPAEAAEILNPANKIIKDAVEDYAKRIDKPVNVRIGFSVITIHPDRNSITPIES